METASIHMFELFSFVKLKHFELQSIKATLNHYPYCLLTLLRMLLRLCKKTILKTAVCRLKNYSSKNRKRIIKPPLFHRAFFIFDYYSPRNYAFFRIKFSCLIWYGSSILRFYFKPFGTWTWLHPCLCALDCPVHITQGKFENRRFSVHTTPEEFNRDNPGADPGISERGALYTTDGRSQSLSSTFQWMSPVHVACYTWTWYDLCEMYIIFS